MILATDSLSDMLLFAYFTIKMMHIKLTVLVRVVYVNHNCMISHRLNLFT